jgi:transcriptional regulator with XRE-family HTH domain
MSKLGGLKKKLLKDPEVRREYDALEEEFALAAAVAKARVRAGLSQAELAQRMMTTQSTIARLESGRGRPSTRTLDRFAKATGHRLKISFEPVEGRKGKGGSGQDVTLEQIPVTFEHSPHAESSSCILVR